jgi:hypothetical protein
MQIQMDHKISVPVIVGWLPQQNSLSERGKGHHLTWTNRHYVIFLAGRLTIICNATYNTEIGQKLSYSSQLAF